MLPEGTFAGRVAIITGGGAGIGEAITSELARLGATTVILGRTREKLDAVCEAITLAGGTARGHAVDVRDRDAVEAAFASVVAEFGRIDHLVNNAAGNFRIRPEEMSPNAWDAVVKIVLYGTWNCTQTAGRHMIERAGAVPCSTSAPRWRIKAARTVHSASAKAGVLSMTKSLAAAWGQHGIRVNALIPGMTEGTGGALIPGMTEGTGGVEALHRTEADPAEALARISLGRMLTKHELAHAASYLLSDFAGYVTGAELVVDGGRSLGRL